MGGCRHGGGDLARGSVGTRGEHTRMCCPSDDGVARAGAQHGEEEEGALMRGETEGVVTA